MVQLSRSDDLLLRRFAMIHSFIQSAKVVLRPILVDHDGHNPLGANAYGPPLSMFYLSDTLARKPQQYRANFAAACCVAATNLGYAYEHTLKLLHFLEKGKNPDLKGRDGHDLTKLYDLLSEPLKDKLSDIHDAVPFNDVEIKEEFKDPGTITFRQYIGHSIDLSRLLNLWTKSELLQASRYKYSDEPKPPDRRRFLVPIRSIYLLEEILLVELTPRLKLKNIRTDLYEVT